MNDTREDSKSVQPTRKRPRIFVSTWIVLSLILAVWSVLAVPGKRYSLQSVMGLNVDHYQHGWPCVHLERSLALMDQAQGIVTDQDIESARSINDSKNVPYVSFEGRQSVRFPEWDFGFLTNRNEVASFEWVDDELDSLPYWFKSNNWAQFGDATRGRWSGLAINIAVLLVTLIVAFFYCQLRFTKLGLKVSFKELAAVTAIIGLGCMYYSSIGIFQKNREILESIESIELYDPRDRFDIYPDTLVRLTGRNCLPRATHYDSLVVDFRELDQGEKQLLSDEFKSLRYLLVAKLTAVDSEMSWSLGYLERAEEVTLIGPKLEPGEWSELKSLPGSDTCSLTKDFFESVARLPELTELELKGCNFNAADFSQLSLAQQLKCLTLDNCPIDQKVVEVVGELSKLGQFSARPNLLSEEQFVYLNRQLPRLLIRR